MMNEPEIHVLVQNGEYWLANNGDLAMLDVTLGRLRRQWPESRIGVMTRAPGLLRAIAPGSEPIVADGRGMWPRQDARLANGFAARLGPRVVGSMETSRLTMRDAGRRWLQRFDQGLRRTAGIGVPLGQGSAERLPEGIRDASLVLAMGGGYVADVDIPQAKRTLELLEYAVDRNIPSAMVGQGLGPLKDPALLALAARVLPRVDFISLRERVHGPQLLNELGVAPDRIMITGDDAVDLAYGLRQEQMGSGLGVCLRLADYSPVADRARQAIATSVQRVATEQGAPLLPLIISEYRAEDRRSTMPLVAGYPHVMAPLGRYAGPRAVARRVSDCRVVVTGAYHLAVFALSQGIPVVALSSSAYYDAKFEGLLAMFGGEGLHLVNLHEDELSLPLTSAIEAAWRSAPLVRESLRDKAVDQIASSKHAFRRVFELVDR